VHVTIRRHPRYRNLRLRAAADGSVRLSAPAAAPARLLQDFVDAQRGWLLEHVPDEPRPVALPDLLQLRAVGETWQLRPDHPGRSPVSRPETRELLLPSGTAATRLKLLEGWLRGHARRHLGATLQELSKDTGLPYSRLTVRGQKTRWGSYSSAGSVSLNWKLLFLPRDLMRYVLIHELCHSRHMNHSPAYWAEVARFVPGLDGIRRRMRDADRFVPAWAGGRGSG